MLLSFLLFHKKTLLNNAISCVLSKHLWILYRHISPPQCYFQRFAGVAIKCTLHCHSIFTPPLPLWSGITMSICDALQCHFGTTLLCHYNATPKVHSNATPKCTPHFHPIIITPMPLSQYSPMPLRSVFGLLICIFATQYVIPIPLQHHFMRSELYCSVHFGLWKLHRHSKDTLLPLRQGKV